MIERLRCQFPLAVLLKVAKMSRSTFYYQRSHEKDRQNHKIMKRIKEIFDQHRGNYGYRRITCVLRNEGMTINHKKVKRLMKTMGLFGKVIRKRNRYSSLIKEQSVKLRETKSTVTSVLISHERKHILTLLNSDLITAKKYIYHRF